MKRRHPLLSRVAAATFVLAAACGSDVSVPTPPLPDLELRLAPSAPTQVIVGQQLLVAAFVTGGDATTARTVRFTSSAPTVATVPTDAGVYAGEVTAVTPGIATITATADANPGVRASMQITVVVGTVTPPDHASLTIGRLSVPGSAAGVDPQNIVGPVDVILNLQQPATGTRATRVDVLVDGVVACQQAVGSAAGTGELTCRLDTRALDGSGVPRFRNGTRQISARAVAGDGSVLTGATYQPVVFNNPNTVNATVVVQSTAGAAGGALDAQGRRWWEGTVVVTARPALYSGETASSVTVCVVPADGEYAGVASCRMSAAALAGNAFTATFPRTASPGGTQGGTAGLTTSDLRILVSTVVGGRQGPGLVAPPADTAAPMPANVGPSIRLDNVSPSTPVLGLAADGGGFWVGSDFVFSPAALVTTPATDPAPGVSASAAAIAYTFFVLENNAANRGLDAAAAAAAGQPVARADALAASDADTRYLLIARAADALGNASFARLNDAAGAARPIGVDRTAPLLAVTGGWSDSGINQNTPFTFAITDALSGAGPNPLRVTLERFGPAQVRACIDVNTRAVIASANGCPRVHFTTGGSVLPVPAAAGYYRIGVLAQDRAGNRSEELLFTVLRDVTPPTITLGQVAADSTTVTVAAALADSIDLRGWHLRFAFAGAPPPFGALTADLPVTPLAAVGSFGAATRVTERAVTGSTPRFNRLAWTDAQGRPTRSATATGVGVGALDVARNFAAVTTPLQGLPADSLPGTIDTFTLTVNATEVCNGLTPGRGDLGSACAAGTPGVARLTASATLSASAALSPFLFVNFYRVDQEGRVWLIGSSAEAGAAGQTRSWVFDWNVAGTAGNTAGGTNQIFAVGVAARGNALRGTTRPIAIRGAASQP